MLSVGLTGGIATGKSRALACFARLGASVVDVDTIAHESIMPGQEAYAGVVTAFGREILRDDATIDRGKLGSIIFADPAQRALLNALVHPVVIGRLRRNIRDFACSCPSGILIADVPLLMECGLQDEFDKIIVVAAPRNLQRVRLMQRNGLQEQDAEQRLQSQLPVADKIPGADYIIDNTGSLENLADQVSRVYSQLQHDLRRKQSGA
jgi:dephospho-CoA kinase